MQIASAQELALLYQYSVNRTAKNLEIYLAQRQTHRTAYHDRQGFFIVNMDVEKKGTDIVLTLFGDVDGMHLIDRLTFTPKNDTYLVRKQVLTDLDLILRDDLLSDLKGKSVRMKHYRFNQEIEPPESLGNTGVYDKAANSGQTRSFTSAISVIAYLQNQHYLYGLHLGDELRYQEAIALEKVVMGSISV